MRERDREREKENVNERWFIKKKGEKKREREVMAFMNTNLNVDLLSLYQTYFIQHPVTPRCRVRKMVGSTNRWRLPESLGSDLLGSSQAIKAVHMNYNNSLVNIITGQYRKL